MNVRTLFVLRFSALSALLVLAGCLTNATHQEDPIPGIRQSALGYTAHDGRLFFQIPRRIDPICNGNDLVYDTLSGFTDSISSYMLSGDSLEWDNPIDSSGGAGVQHFSKFDRIGSGSGLLGLWRKARNGYRVVSGELSPRLQATMDSDLIIGNQEDGYTLVDLRITADSMEVYTQFNSAGLVNANWTKPIDPKEQPDSLRWDMDFRIVDRNTVEYHGRKTGETVRVARFDNNDLDYSSDNPSHPHYHYSEMPATCPDEFEPDWYPAFQNANAKGQTALPKAQIRPKSLKSDDQVPSPLKFRGFFLN